MAQIEFQSNSRLRSIAILKIAGLLLLLTACHESAKPSPEPTISFTQVPQRDLGDLNREDVIEGTVSGSRAGQNMVVYSKTGGFWWLQPRLNSPFTPILPDGVWRNEVHLATDYAALLVDSTYHPAPVLTELPKVGHGIETFAASSGQERSSSFFVNFSGFQWRVRKVPSNRGGARNPYDPNNVYVDQSGALHLQIVKRNNEWTCSEVNVTRSLGYGTYVFTVEDTSNLDPAVSFTMFTWDHSSSQGNHGEFDVNIGRWGDPQNESGDAEFAVQPAFLPLNMSRFKVPGGKLQHTIVWEEGRVTMLTSQVSGKETRLVSKHVFTDEVPRPVDESVRMALYVYSDPNHKSPAINHRTEVVVDHFEFLP
ncbi:MAG: hypothetical protein ABSG34_02860 [Candidatus Sulfotelmatobacter sp.]|jgi:hypothetical protein